MVELEGIDDIKNRLQKHKFLYTVFTSTKNDSTQTEAQYLVLVEIT